MSSDTVDTWIEALGSKDVMEQIAAQEELVKSSDPRAVSHLLSKVASDEGWSGKVNAGIVIRKLGARAVEPLLQVLRQGETKQKALAAEMLGIIQDAKAVVPLIEALEDAEATVRSRSAASLGALGDARAFDPLLQALADKEKSVQSNAAAALGRLRNPHAFEPLVSALQSSNVPGAALGLGHLGDKRALPSLIAGLRSEDKDVRRSAAIGLGHLGDDSAVDQLITALGDQESSVRQGAVFALGKLRDTRAVEPMCRLLQDPDKHVRWRTAAALGDVGDASALEPLGKALDDKDSLVKHAAEDALKKVKERTAKAARISEAGISNRDVPRFIKMLERPRWMFWVNRKAAVRSLGLLGAEAGERAITVLGSVVSQPGEQPDLRTDAAKALASLGPAAKPALPALLRCLADMQKEITSYPPGLREGVTEALGAMGNGARPAVPGLVALARYCAAQVGDKRVHACGQEQLKGFLWETTMTIGMRRLERIPELEIERIMGCLKTIGHATSAVGKIIGEKDWSYFMVSYYQLVIWWNEKGKDQRYD